MYKSFAPSRPQTTAKHAIVTIVSQLSPRFFARMQLRIIATAIAADMHRPYMGISVLNTCKNGSIRYASLKAYS